MRRPGAPFGSAERTARRAALLPIEINLGAAVDPYAVAGLRKCMKNLGLRLSRALRDKTTAGRSPGR
jgi:hypothetical protein